MGPARGCHRLSQAVTNCHRLLQLVQAATGWLHATGGGDRGGGRTRAGGSALVFLKLLPLRLWSFYGFLVIPWSCFLGGPANVVFWGVRRKGVSDRELVAEVLGPQARPKSYQTYLISAYAYLS